MSLILTEMIWSDKYAPHTLEECLLPEATRKTLKSYLRKKNIPNMLFSGQPGIGKTATARALLEEAGNEFIVINGSLKGNIDTLRNEIQQFASTISFNGEKKYVIIDEADYLSHQTQAALRGFIDEHSANCGYIFTCNYRNKIMDALSDSRLLSEIQFVFSGDEKATLAKQLYEKLVSILKNEHVEYTATTVQRFIVKHLKASNDIRKLLILAQKSSASGVFEPSESADAYSRRFDSLVDALNSKDFTKIRTWIGENSDIEANIIFRYIFDNAAKLVKNEKLISALVIIIGEYQYKHAFVADAEINLTACMAEIIANCL